MGSENRGVDADRRHQVHRAAERLAVDHLRPQDRERPRGTLGARPKVVLLVEVEVLVFDAGRTLDFVDNELEFVGFGVHLGRWAVKNLALVGVLGGIVLLVGLPKLVAALERRRVSTIVRFAALTIVVSELLYFRFPFKPVHLLPVMAGTALLVGASPAITRSTFQEIECDVDAVLDALRSAG